MFKKLAVWVVTCGMSLAFIGNAAAFFHNYRINELYSNADGSIQFIELTNGPVNGEMFSEGVTMSVTAQGGSASHTFTFPSNLPSSVTANTSVLLATQGFANLGIVTPDFIVPAGFLFTGGGTVNLGTFDIVTYSALPTNGILSMNRDGTTAVNSPRNFAGKTGTVSTVAGTTTTTQAPTTTSTTTTAPATTTTSTTSTTVGSTTTTTQVGGAGTVTLNLVSGWNLVGNGGTGTIDVASVFGDTSRVNTVWKWIANGAKWAFYAPSLVGPQLTDYAARNNYDVLTTINSGEGFWVNARIDFSMQFSAPAALGSNAFQTPLDGSGKLLAGWNLIAIGDNKTPSAFNKALGATPPAAGDIPLNLTTLWAWDAGLMNWYFYAPSLEKSGGLLNYVQSKSYLDFGTKVLTPTTGFWVNKP